MKTTIPSGYAPGAFPEPTFNSDQLYAGIRWLLAEVKKMEVPNGEMEEMYYLAALTALERITKEQDGRNN